MYHCGYKTTLLFFSRGSWYILSFSNNRLLYNCITQYFQILYRNLNPGWICSTITGPHFPLPFRNVELPLNAYLSVSCYWRCYLTKQIPLKVHVQPGCKDNRALCWDSLTAVMGRDFQMQWRWSISPKKWKKMRSFS